VTEELAPRRYRAAGGVVVSPSGERVLVLVRPKRPGPDGQPEVRLPKGHIEAGEGRRQAACREVSEEAGLTNVEVLADLGHQSVEFDWRGQHYIRDESYFLMTLPPGDEPEESEEQFEPRWLTWQEALEALTYEAERQWLRRAQARWQALQGSG